MNREFSAWLLDGGEEERAAISPYVLREVISQHELHRHPCHRLPLAGPRCRHLMIWRDHAVPLVHLKSCLRGEESTAAELQRGTRIIIALPATATVNTVRYCALQLAAVPQPITIDPDHQCPIPESSWARLSAACFLHRQQPVPILNPDFLLLAAPEGHGL